MKKIIIRMLICLGVFFLLASKGFAVWPAHTSLENEAMLDDIENVDTTDMSTLERLHLVIQKLTHDENQIAVALQNLKKDEAALIKISAISNDLSQILSSQEVSKDKK